MEAFANVHPVVLALNASLATLCVRRKAYGAKLAKHSRSASRDMSDSTETQFGTSGWAGHKATTASN